MYVEAFNPFPKSAAIANELIEIDIPPSVSNFFGGEELGDITEGVLRLISTYSKRNDDEKFVETDISNIFLYAENAIHSLQSGSLSPGNKYQRNARTDKDYAACIISDGPNSFKKLVDHFKDAYNYLDVELLLIELEGETGLDRTEIGMVELKQLAEDLQTIHDKMQELSEALTEEVIAYAGTSEGKANIERELISYLLQPFGAPIKFFNLSSLGVGIDDDPVLKILDGLVDEGFLVYNDERDLIALIPDNAIDAIRHTSPRRR